MAEPTVVVFDWYATLAAPNATDFWARVPELVVDAGGVADPGAVRDWEFGHPLEHVVHSSSESAYRDLQRQRFETLLDRCGVPEPARTELVDRVEHVRYTRTFTVFDGVVDALEELRAQSVTIGICSNWDWDLERHLRSNEVDVLVDFVVCSAVVGFRKPHPAIFERVVERAGVPADRILFVGDDWTDDIGGAAAAGMQVMHVSTGTSCADLDHGSVPCADTLLDVVAHALATRGPRR